MGALRQTILVSLLMLPVILQTTASAFCSGEYAQGDPIETRYMLAEIHVANGLSAYKLGEPFPSSQGRTVENGWSNQGWTVTWGMRVWRRMSSAGEIEMTAGVPVATVSRSGFGRGLQNTTWDCPQIMLEENDSIVVRIYTKIGGSIEWGGCGNFTTEQLSAVQLYQATWKICYYTTWRAVTDYSHSPPVETVYGGFSFGYDPSCIENFRYSVVPELSSFILVPLFMSTTLIAVIFYKKNRVD